MSEKIQENRSVPQVLGTIVIFLSFLLSISPMFIPTPAAYNGCHGNISSTETKDCNNNSLMLDVSKFL